MIVATGSMAVKLVARMIAGGGLVAGGLLLTVASGQAAHGVPIVVVTTAPEYAKRLLDGGQPIV